MNPKTPPILFKPEHAALAVQSAQRNGGILTRTAAGIWRGHSDDPQQYTTEIIAALVRDGRATYTRFKEGTRAATEVRMDVAEIHARYQMS